MRSWIVAKLGILMMNAGLTLADRGFDVFDYLKLKRTALFIITFGFWLGEHGTDVTSWGANDPETTISMEVMKEKFVRQKHRVAGMWMKLWMYALMLVTAFSLSVSAQPPRKKNAPQPGAEPPPVSLEEAAKLEAVITTDLGVIRFEFLPAKAPKHVQAFVKNARAGFYDGSAFHRVIRLGIIQGGDPLLKDPKTPRAKWGTGALNQLPDEFSDVKHLTGTVSTVRIPGKANSDGAQFFICASSQPQLDGQYSAFGQVTEGIEVVDQISQAEADDEQKTTTPIKIVSIKIEAKREEPFRDATVDEMRKEVILHTSHGDITVAVEPELAPEHVRNFLKLVQTGWYDHTPFHRIVPNFVIQGGMGSGRGGNRVHYADKWVRPLKGEFSQTRKHIRGVLSMARTDDPNSALTSFFIVLAPAANLDGKYSIFGKVVDGFETLDRIEKVPRGADGQTPTERVELIEAAIKP
ncbi:MAG TPA: peptidylprolyl isomerase [Blastocatellia bacterium]|nr:peptidylprolyl isomerase [Blastocatellia bacterium]